MFNDVGPALGVGFYRVQQAQRVLVHDVLAEQGRAHEDGSEDVVQVMGDAAGQPAYAFQPLRAEQLGLETLLLGDVLFDGHKVDGVATLIPARE